MKKHTDKRLAGVESLSERRKALEAHHQQKLHKATYWLLRSHAEELRPDVAERHDLIEKALHDYVEAVTGITYKRVEAAEVEALMQKDLYFTRAPIFTRV